MQSENICKNYLHISRLMFNITFFLVQNGLNISKNHYQSDASSCDGSGDDNEDTFYTPPSSPSLLLEDVESEDDFNDTELPKYDIFIDGWV